MPEHQQVGPMVRRWRLHRRLSQLELAGRAGVSTRHLSCIETGRAHPTAAMIERLSDSLDVPLRDRNGLLLAGGFAPQHGPRALDDGALAPVLDGLRDLLDALLPAPALLLDDEWTIVDVNETAQRVLSRCDPALLEPPMNAVRISLHPQGLGASIENLSAWGASIWHRVRARAEATRNPRLWALVDEIETYVPRPSSPPSSADPVLSLALRSGDQVVHFFSIAAQLETANDATLAELHVEAFLPADLASREWLVTSSV